MEIFLDAESGYENIDDDGSFRRFLGKVEKPQSYSSELPTDNLGYDVLNIV
jgi:hypothetical protein